jgi:hypothetical protein
VTTGIDEGGPGMTATNARDGFAVVRTGGEYKLVAQRQFATGSRLFAVNGQITETPTRYSVQVGAGIHLDLPGGHAPEELMDQFFWRFTNHSCQPNAQLRGHVFFALRPIEPWQEITFHYDTTEYEMAEPFDCRCGAANCDGRIQGFRYRTGDEQERLRPWLADHLQAMVNVVHR